MKEEFTCLICGKPTDKPGNACSIECAERYRDNELRLRKGIEELKENASYEIRSQDIDGYKQALEDVTQLISVKLLK